jgi:hypothetical protein
MFRTVPAIIGESLIFLRKQPALPAVIGLFLFLPLLLLAQIPRLENSLPYFQMQSTESSLVLLLGGITFNVLTVWGSTCVLLIAKRLLQAKAGRTRTSLRAVSAQAAPYFLPYLLTSILRGIIALLWAVLFLIPVSAAAWLIAPALLAAPQDTSFASMAPWLLLLLIPIIAALASLARTAFTPVLIFHEDIAYRPALRKSSQMVRKRFLPILLALTILVALLFVPAQLFSMLLLSMTGEKLSLLGLLGDALSSALNALAGALYLIGITLLYDKERPIPFVSN